MSDGFSSNKCLLGRSQNLEFKFRLREGFEVHTFYSRSRGAPMATTARQIEGAGLL